MTEKSCIFFKLSNSSISSKCKQTADINCLLFLLYSYAGLHCVVIKGYSKSAGYQPGVKFEDNRFRNSWNAVYVAGAWRFVQCNWGARHLVNAKEVPKPGKAKSDSLRWDLLVFLYVKSVLPTFSNLLIAKKKITKL